jgi:DNA-binding transcriptional LysR family regulator
MMLDLNQVRLFVQVVRARSFAEASRRLNVPPNSLSRHVRQLEEQLATRLMQRSTRKLTLTEAGLAFFNRCAPAVDHVLDAGKDVVGGSRVPSGVVRVAAPADFLDLFAMGWLAQFQERCPKVRLDFVLNDARADLIGEGIDVAFRGSADDDPRHTVRRLGTQYFRLVASPAYLARRGTPRQLADLEAHDCLTVGGRQERALWKLTGPQGPVEVRVAARLSANSARALLRCCVEGLGIALLPSLLINEDHKAQRLVQVLPEYRREGVDFCVVLPSRQQTPAAVSAFIDFAAAKIESMIDRQQPRESLRGATA